MTDHEHHHHEHENGSYGMALGFRIFENDGKLYLAEVEVTPYVDEPQALGATLVFHPLDGLDPTQVDEEADWPAWHVDIDDELTRDTDTPMRKQFTAILRQVAGLSEGQLGEYLAVAKEEGGEEG
jgi:hypothetical protein